MCLRNSIIAAKIEFQTRLMYSSLTNHLATSLQLPKALKKTQSTMWHLLVGCLGGPEAVGWVPGKHRLH